MSINSGTSFTGISFPEILRLEMVVKALELLIIRFGGMSNRRGDGVQALLFGVDNNQPNLILSVVTIYD